MREFDKYGNFSGSTRVGIIWSICKLAIFCHIVCVFLETNITEKKKEHAEEKSESCDGKYGKLWYSCYSHIRGSISFISLRIYVLVRFATFSAFFCILWLHIIYIYIYILLYILIAYNFNLYTTYVIFIIPDLSSLYFVTANAGHFHYRITWSI